MQPSSWCGPTASFAINKFCIVHAAAAHRSRQFHVISPCLSLYSFNRKHPPVTLVVVKKRNGVFGAKALGLKARTNSGRHGGCADLVPRQRNSAHAGKLGRCWPTGTGVNEFNLAIHGKGTFSDDISTVTFD